MKFLNFKLSDEVNDHLPEAEVVVRSHEASAFRKGLSLLMSLRAEKEIVCEKGDVLRNIRGHKVGKSPLRKKAKTFQLENGLQYAADISSWAGPAN